MNCLTCEEKEMVPVFTDQGVEIDFCPDCGGIWLDKGEIFYFAKKPKQIQRELDEAIKRGRTCWI
jgi:Zn-finger nucleic acid-binding protein